MCRFNAEVIATGEAKILFAAYDSNLWIKLLYYRSLVLIGSIIHYYHLHVIAEGDRVNKFTGIFQPVKIDSDNRQLYIQGSINYTLDANFCISLILFF